MADRIQIRGDNHTDLINANPILSNREIMIDFENGERNAKVGDGHTNYRDLDYFRYNLRVNGKKLASTQSTVDIFIPQNISELKNDVEFQTESQVIKLIKEHGGDSSLGTSFASMPIDMEIFKETEVTGL